MFNGKPIVIEGFEIPYDSPLFLTILSIHILGGLTCVVSGVFAMLSRKQKGVHTRSGKIYYYGLCIVFSTAVIISIARWKEDYHLFFFGLVSFSACIAGKMAARKKWNKWGVYHICGMGISYIFLLIAFYVDNGKFLPIWKNLHPAIYWLLPLLAGIPLLARTLLKNPLTKHYFKKK
jgi:hypothetical protein